MSVYIKDMEMPSKCYTCLFMYHGMRSEQVWCTAIENRWLDLRETLCEERHKDCPLVPVPEHGRLIDADVLVHSYYHAPSFPNLCKAINAAPTIIPADKGGER